MTNYYGNGTENGKGYAIAGLALGIAAIVFGFCGIATIICSIIGLTCGIVGLVMALKGSKEYPGGLSTAALVLAIIGLVFSAIFFFTCGLCYGGLACASCAVNNAANAAAKSAIWSLY